ncbi:MULTISPECIES: hypothetical protein [unclassified Okeania]|uniref:hypothetical protein n=1 Tax=unclassified Okeania TaxID=2634635 RepID=UPI0013C993D6|nr:MULTISPECIES: hypothetical protein [unclassified Okeania]NET14237.1 hypothetical protein [Okeania sp. SIO1H6]
MILPDAEDCLPVREKQKDSDPIVKQKDPNRASTLEEGDRRQEENYMGIRSPK